MVIIMKDHQALVWLAAVSGLIGALLTQLMTGLFSYINDRRKQKTEVKNLYRNKKIEIGENFYFMSGELMAMIKKNIAYWKNRQDYRSEASLSFLKLEMDRLDVYQSKLQTENWKYNLVGIYYIIPYSFREMLEDNKRSHELYLKMLDFPEIINKTLPQEKNDLLEEYQSTLTELCLHYQNVYNRMEANMEAVSLALRKDFEH
jgi:hypothetical protein